MADFFDLKIIRDEGKNLPFIPYDLQVVISGVARWTFTKYEFLESERHRNRDQSPARRDRKIPRKACRAHALIHRSIRPVRNYGSPVVEGSCESLAANPFRDCARKCRSRSRIPSASSASTVETTYSGLAPERPCAPRTR